MRKPTDALDQLAKRFQRLSETGDANQWAVGELTWIPDLRTYFRTHAAARLSEVEAILARDITPPPAPPAVDVRGYPPGTAAQVQRRQQLAAKDTAARSAMKDLHAILLGLQAERAGGGDPPSASRSPVETTEAAVPPAKKGKGK